MTHSGFTTEGLGDLPAELRQLVQALIDKLDPVVRLSVGLLADGEGPGKCQQVWCPVCALVALANDEQHPLLTAIAEHSTTLLDAVRAMLEDQSGAGGAHPEPPTDPSGPDGGGTDPEDPGPPGAAGPGRYQPIEVSVEE
ncbi:MAG: hypothetical protein P4L86_30125 [Mycobacterium sp.]|nr:hypothetical protein [Mycobacterium sp.]